MESGSLAAARDAASALIIAILASLAVVLLAVAFREKLLGRRSS